MPAAVSVKNWCRITGTISKKKKRQKITGFHKDFTYLVFVLRLLAQTEVSLFQNSEAFLFVGYAVLK